jgi:hypothetical protein
MNEQVDYDALLKCANHLTGNQKMALGDMSKFLGYVIFIYKLETSETRAILEALLDTQMALETMMPEKVNMK